MSAIKPMGLVESMSGKLCGHSDIYFFRRNGKVFTGKLCNPSTKASTYNRQNELYIFLKRKVHLFDTFSHENEQLISQLLIFYNRAFSAAFKLVSKLFQSYYNTLSMSFNCYFKSISMLLKHYAFVLNPMQKC